MTPDDHFDAIALDGKVRSRTPAADQPIPDYLTRHYRWAYIDPPAIAFFDQGWVVNLILWGQFRRLSERAFAELGDAPLEGTTLQVACVYGDLSPRLAQRVGPHGQLEIVDIVPQQLRNVARKIGSAGTVTTRLCNSADLGGSASRYDRALVFFLLHEQPEAVRRATLSEVIRVVRPGGRIVIVDYHQPHRLHPLRYFMRPVLRRLEPFAMDLWRDPLETWLPPEGYRILHHTLLFGRLYQVLVLQADPHAQPAATATASIR